MHAANFSIIVCIDSGTCNTEIKHGHITSMQDEYCCMLTPCMECLYLREVSTDIVKEDLSMKKDRLWCQVS